MHKNSIYTSLTQTFPVQPEKNIVWIAGKQVSSKDKSEFFANVILDHPLKAYFWAENKTNNNNTYPLAIIAYLSFLETDNFLFLKKVKENPQLENIPFIVIADTSQGLQSSEARKMGIDDVYSHPLDWENISKRIHYLHKLHKTNPAKFYPQEVVHFLENHSGTALPFWKRSFDILAAGSLLILLLPLLILVAILIRIDSKGPIFYLSKRAGKDFNIFDFYKFRSMYCGTDVLLKDLQHLNQYNLVSGTNDAETVAFHKLTNDPRITPIGKFIRKTSIDELPQLINVLKGDMSLVGNRPLPLYEAELLTTDQWAHRFLAPAGITGLWQVSRKSNQYMSAKERIDLDIEYANNISLWLDLKILFKTFPAIFQPETI